MKNTLRSSTIILITLLSFLIKGYSQGWAQPGATWAYSNYFFGPGDGFNRFIYTGDTTIQGFNCSKIHGWHHWYFMPSPLTHDDLGEFYFRMDSNIIYRYHSGNFYTLFDFNAQQGDTVNFIWENEIISNNCDSFGYYIVNSIGTANINGFIEPYQDITYYDNQPQTNPFNERIYKRFGGIQFLYFYHICIDTSGGIYEGPGYGPLCNYEDSAIGVFNNGVSCNISLGLSDIESSNKGFSILQNYKTNTVEIQNNIDGEKTDYIISDLKGALIKSGNFKTRSFALDITDFKKGIYLIQLKSKYNLKSFKIIR